MVYRHHHPHHQYQRKSEESAQIFIQCERRSFTTIREYIFFGLMSKMNMTSKRTSSATMIIVISKVRVKVGCCWDHYSHSTETHLSISKLWEDPAEGVH